MTEPPECHELRGASDEQMFAIDEHVRFSNVIALFQARLTEIKNLTAVAKQASNWPEVERLYGSLANTCREVASGLDVGAITYRSLTPGALSNAEAVEAIIKAMSEMHATGP